MAVLIQDLLDVLSEENVELVAGKNGTDKLFMYTHTVEKVDIGNYLEGGELVLTTGMALQNEYNLFDIVKCSNDKNACGILLNIGPYIKNIPEYIIEYGNTHNFCIFSAPWDVYLPNLVKKLMSTLIKLEENTIEIEMILKNIVLGIEQKFISKNKFVEKGWDINGAYYVAVIKYMEHKEKIEQVTKSFKIKMSYLVQSNSTFCINNEIVIIFQHSINNIEEVVKKIDNIALAILKNKKNYTVTVGDKTDGIMSLHHSYMQALELQSLCLISEKFDDLYDRNIICYENVGLYKLLIGNDNVKIKEQIYNNTIKIIREYDRINKTQICNSLKCYVYFNGSVTLASEKLFLHKNTILKHINKIQDILNVDLSQWKIRNEIMLGFMIENVLTNK